MPRLEILRPNPPPYEPSPTVDMCKVCFNELKIEEGDRIDETYGEIDDWEDAIFGSTSVEHPPYEDGDKDQYICCICGEALTAKDN